MTSNCNYMHVIPNSHFWTDLKQIVASIGYELERQKREAENVDNCAIYACEPLTKNYILIGLGNSLTHGYKLKPIFKEPIKVGSGKYPIFVSIEDMIDYVQSDAFNLIMFKNIIEQTIEVEINLTNEIKMEREHVYKRIDAERKYQDLVWSGGQRNGDVPDEEKSVAEWLNYIEYHLSKAKDCNYHLSKEDALAELRKVAALAVRAMEIHGCPERRMPDRVGKLNVNKDGSTCKCGNCDCKK